MLLASLLLVIAIVTVGCGGPDVGDLSGRVTDSSGISVAQAQVSLGTVTATTGSDGAFSIKGVEQGTYTLGIEAPGKLAHSQSVQIGKTLSTVNVVLQDIPLPPECQPRQGDPEGMRLVYCEPFTAGDTLDAYGWKIGSGEWKVVQAGGKRWIEGTSGGEQRYAYVSVPEMANANKIVVEYTATYVSPGNTWALQFLADRTDQAHGSAFMLLSAWDGLYYRRYHANNAVAESTIKAPPKIDQGEVVTIRATYDHVAKTVDLLRNGQRPLEFPAKLDDAFLLKGPDQTLLKLFVNVGGAAGDTTARWTDIRVWVN